MADLHQSLRYFLIVLRGVFLQGDSYTLLMDQYWPMALIGLVSLILARLAVSPSDVLRDNGGTTGNGRAKNHGHA